ncbi:MAG: hypothetical protein V4650_06820 [Pseudomonadota bacterium]
MKTTFGPALALLLLFAAATPVLAAEQPSTPAAEEESDVDDEDVITCEREGVTGSHVKKRRVCSSEKSRRELRERTGKALESIPLQGAALNAGGG